MAVSSCARSSASFSSSSFGSVSRAGFESRSSSSAWPSTRRLDLGFLVALLRLLDEVGHALLEALEVGEHQLGLDRLGVGDRIDPALDMGDVAALEAAQHMDDRVDLADVAEELVAEALALRGAAHQPGNVDEFELGLDLLADLAISAIRSSRGSGTATRPTLGSIVQNG